jgi:hypothetical protein
VLRPGWLAALALAACSPQSASRVEPTDYRAFYVWAGVKPGPEVATAEELYVLGGEARREVPQRLIQLRPQEPRLRHQRLWLVIRAQSIDWTPGLRASILRDLDRWAAANPGLQGLQVDFDASTPRLGEYGAFLKDLRGWLPRRYKLSVTGLMDWSANGDPAALAGLKGVVDEVVVQSYQHRTTIPGYERYLRRLARVPVPHKVALVEDGEWREPAALRHDPLFLGYVVFLLGPERKIPRGPAP